MLGLIAACMDCRTEGGSGCGVQAGASRASGRGAIIAVICGGPGASGLSFGTYLAQPPEGLLLPPMKPGPRPMDPGPGMNEGRLLTPSREWARIL